MSIAYRIMPSVVFAAPGATIRTFLLAIAPAGHGLELVEFGIFFDGITSSAVPCTVDIVQSTQAGPGTPVAVNVTQVRGRGSGAPAPTGGCNYTVEPTALTVVGPLYVAQYMGSFVEQMPLGRGLETDASGGTIRAIGLRITASAAVNVRGYLEVEAVG